MNNNMNNNIREDFEIDYSIGGLDKKDIKSLIDNSIRKNYLSVCIQMVNNNLRTIFISYMSKKGKILEKKINKLISFLEKENQNNQNPDNLKNINKFITHVLKKSGNKNQMKQNLDLDRCFIDVLKLIDTDEKQKQNFHYHLLHNCVLPINSLSDLISLIEGTLKVRNYLRHPHEKKRKSLTPEIFTATLNLICILLLPSVSKIYIDRFKLNGGLDIWEYWNKKHRANLDIYFGLERSKRHYKKKDDGQELNQEQLKKLYEKINKASKKIARDDDHWKKLHTIYTKEHSAFGYWKFKKTFNYIGKEFIEKRFEIKNPYNDENPHNDENPRPSFKYEIYPTYILYTKLSFIILELYGELLKELYAELLKNNKIENLKEYYEYVISADLKKINKETNKETEKSNPFLKFHAVTNAISHNRIWEIDLTKQLCDDILYVCNHFKSKNIARKFIQDIVVLCKKENYKIQSKDGAKLKYCVNQKQYYSNNNKFEQSDCEKHNKLYVCNDDIIVRKKIRTICKGWKNNLQLAIKNNGFKEPEKAKKGKKSRKNG